MRFVSIALGTLLLGASALAVLAVAVVLIRNRKGLSDL